MGDADARIERDCRAAIKALGSFPRVHLFADRGWVRMLGWVPHGAERWQLEAAVAQVPGVVGVHAQLGAGCPPEVRLQIRAGSG